MPELIEKTASTIERCMGIAGDIRNTDDVKKVVRKTIDEV